MVARSDGCVANKVEADKPCEVRLSFSVAPLTPTPLPMGEGLKMEAGGLRLTSITGPSPQPLSRWERGSRLRNDIVNAQLQTSIESQAPPLAGAALSGAGVVVQVLVDEGVTVLV